MATSAAQLTSMCLWICLSACLAVANGHGQDSVCASGSTCGASLLQMQATPSKRSSTPASADRVGKEACPAKGKKCTIIAVPKDSPGIMSHAMSAAQKYQNKAQVSQLKAVGQIIVDFGKDQHDDCCNAYEVLKHTAGMDVVEFDMPVHAFGPPDIKADPVDDASYPDDDEDVPPTHTHPPTDTHPPRIAIDVIPEPTPKGDASSPASTTQECPDWRKECTLIVVLNKNAEESKISKPYEDHARVTHLQALGQVILEFGKDKPTECCDASKALRRKAGVKIVEFNQPITAWVPDEPEDHGKPHSGATRPAHLWNIMPLIAAWLVIA